MPVPSNNAIATLLRESATYVERNEVSPILYKTLEALNLYIETADKRKHERANANSNSSNSNSNSNPPATNPEAETSKPKPRNPKNKPSFQRPKNPKSNLIANGWIEQQRRSRMRIVWKEILASLVEARQPGEETTLWIQRQVESADGKEGKLEALHQIPMKWLEEVTYLDFYGDFRFSVKVYNVADDFIFRTDSEESCRQWVMTLQSAKEASQNGTNSTRTTGSTATNGTSHTTHSSTSRQQQQQQQPKQQQKQQGSSDIFPDLLDDNNPSKSNSNTKERMSIKELRAIAHGAGYNTRGMERADLEKIAAHHAPVSSKVPAPPVSKTNPTAASSPRSGGSSSGSTPNSTSKKSPSKPKSSSSTPAASTNNPGFNTKDYIYQKQKAEEERRKNEKAKNMHTRNPFESKFESSRFGGSSGNAPSSGSTPKPNPTSQRRGSAGAGYNPKTSQAQPKQPHPSSSFPAGTSSRPSQQPFTSRPQTQPQSTQQQQRPPQQKQQPSQQQQRQQQQQQQRPGFRQQRASERMFDPTSPINHKYKNMADDASAASAPPPPPTSQSRPMPAAAAAPAPTPAAPVDDDAKITAIKRTILMKWALVPPQYNMLRPIDQLLCNIHNIFPPACGAPAHSYFAKWKAIQPNDLILNAATMGNAPDPEKLKKAVRKLRFFLHPDRLPRDFTPDQAFCTKMLWDVSSDAWEEYQKNKDDLDWIHK